MALKIFDATNAFNRRGKPPIVNFDIEGRINFSVEAVKELKLTEGMKLAFAYDDKDTDIIFFYECETGIPLQSTATKKGTLRLSIYCRPLAKELMNFFKYQNNHSFRISKDTTKVGKYNAWFIQKHVQNALWKTEQ